MSNIKPRKSHCPSCHSQMGSAFCEMCGEKRLDENSRSLSHILNDYIENLTSFDNKIWRTFKLLILYPGKFDKNYHDGRRINYLKPISLFLIMNFMFVLFSPITDFNVTLIDQLKLQPYSQWIKPLHENTLLPESGLSASKYESQYNQSVKILSRSTIIIQAVLLFLFVMIINHKKGYYPGDHLVYSLNLHSWYMAWIVILMVVIKSLIFLLNILNLDIYYGYWYFNLLPIGVIIYMGISIKILYQMNWWQTLIRVVIMFFAMRLCHVIYRLIQFFLVTALI